MTFLLVTVWAAAIVAGFALAVDALSHIWPRARPAARRAPALALAAVGLALATLVTAFLRGDLSVFYVWQHVDLSYPWWLRVAGVWGGQAGTFLLWSGAILGAVLVEQRRATGPTWRRARTVLLAIATVLLTAPIALHLGVETAAFGLTGQEGFQLGAGGPSPTEVRPAGDGLNPLLESPYMSIHPLVEFLAYGLAAVPFAYGLVHLFTGDPVRDAAHRWARAAWLAFLSALTLGGLWAYNVLSFGGYWIWDPVEVGNLLPFVALTAYLHADPVRRRGWLQLLAPASAVLAFVLVLFASFVTRTGLWSSVHAFLPVGLSVAIQDPTARLARAVQAGFQPAFATRLFAAGLGAAVAGMAAFHARRVAEGLRRRAWLGLAGVYGLVGLAGFAAPGATVEALGGLATTLSLGRPLLGIGLVVAFAAAPLVYALATAPEDTPASPRQRGGQLTLAAALLALTALATGLLLVLGVNGYRPSVYWQRAPFLAGPILALIGLAFHPGSFEARVATVAAGAGVGALVGFVTGSWAWAAVPLGLVVAASVGTAYLVRVAPDGWSRARWRALLLAAAGLLGLVQWASPGSIVLGGLSFASPGAYVPVGIAASLGAIAAPTLEATRGPSRWIGPVLGVLAVGYGLGALLALAAVLVSRQGTGARVGPSGVAVPAIHVGLALLVVGVAVSTYAATETSFDQGDPLVRGEPRTFGDHTLELVDGALVDEDGDSRPDAVEAVVHVRQDGAFVGEETLRLKHSTATGFTGQGSFAPDGSPAVRSWWGDIALNADTGTPLSIRVDEPGANATWVVANGPPPRGLQGQVEAVSMGVDRLPAVNLVWGSIALISGGFLARLRT